MQFRLSYHLAGTSPWLLDVRYLFFVCGIQYSPFNRSPAASFNLGVLAGEDEHKSFYSAILKYILKEISPKYSMEGLMLKLKLQYFGHVKPNVHWKYWAGAPILGPPDAKNWLNGKDCDAGEDWRQEEKGMAEDEVVGWQHWFDGHEFE